MDSERPGLSPVSSPPREPRLRGAATGVVAALLYGLIVYGWARWQAPNSGMLLVAFLVGAPIAACVLAVRLSDPKGVRGAGEHVGVSALTVTAMLAAAGAVLREGAVCLVMAAPIFYGSGLIAGWIAGRSLRRRAGRLMCLSVLILPLLGVPAEVVHPAAPQTRWVRTETHVAAPPSAVWAALTDVRSIDDAEQRWNFSHDLVGIPRPKDARMEGTGVGAVRHLTWAKDVRFEEHITAWRPGETLAWTFEIGPEASNRMLDEHLRVNSPYLRLEEGRYTLSPAADGGTDLVLTTRYWIRTPVNAYAGWWGGVFLGDFHRNVMGVIKARAERGDRGA